MRALTAGFLFAVLLVSVWFGGRLNERFAPDSTALQRHTAVFCDNILNHITWIGDYGVARSISNPEVFADIALQAEGLPTELTKGARNILAVLDPLDRSRLYADSVTVVGTAPKGYFIQLTSQAVAHASDCTIEWRGHRIGYMEPAGRNFIQAVLKGYRIPKEEVQLESINVFEWDRLAELLGPNGRVDRIIAYVIPSSPFHGLIKRQDVVAQGFAKLDADRVRAFYPWAKLVKGTSVNTPTKTFPLQYLIVDPVPAARAFVLPKDADSDILEMSMEVVSLEGSPPEGLLQPQPQPSNAPEGFISRLEIPEGTYDPTYKCFGEANTDSKALCESAFDVIGRPKPIDPDNPFRPPPSWDRPCVRDTDCPYFNSEGGGRGGCKPGGMCELPVGVRRTGFRTTDTSDPIKFAPFCYGCNDPTDPGCCARQYEAEYVFPNDTDARKAADKPFFLE